MKMPPVSQLVACEGAFCGASRGLPDFQSSNGKIRLACRSAVSRALAISLDAAPSNPANRLDAISNHSQADRRGEPEILSGAICRRNRQPGSLRGWRFEKMRFGVMEKPMNSMGAGMTNSSVSGPVSRIISLTKERTHSAGQFFKFPPRDTPES